MGVREGAGGPAAADARGRRFVLAVSVCVAVPSAVAAARAIRWGWVPVSDQATISTRAVDVLTGATPRLGQLSGASAEVGLPTRSPGPMGYWPFAVTARWGPLWGTAAVAAALSGTAMVASVRLAARRGGPALAGAIGLGLVLSARAVNPANLASTWNPAIGIAPLVLLVLLAWSVGVGEVRRLPLAVLVASFCAQVHGVFIVPAALVLVIGLVAGLAPSVRPAWVALRARRLRWRGPVGRAVLGGVAVAVGCWALPLLDQVVGDPGNLTRLARARSGEPLAGELVGRVLVDAVGVLPAFVGGDTPPDEHVSGVLLRSPATVAVVTAVLVVAGLVGLAARALRRRDREGAVPPLLVLALLASGAAVVRATPSEQVLVLTYTTWWLVPAGMLAWVVLGWGVARDIGPRPVRLVPGTNRTSWPTVGGGIVCGAMLAVAVLAPVRAEPEEPIHPAARAAGDAVVPLVDPGRRYLVAGEGRAGEQLVSSTAYRIRRAGGRPVVPGNDGLAAGPRYVVAGRRCAAVIRIGPRRSRPPSVAVLAEVRVDAREGPSTVVSVTLAPDDGPPSC